MPVPSPQPSCTPRSKLFNRPLRPGRFSSERGQVIIEYVLLMVVALGLAAMIMKSVVSRDTSSPGFLMKKWQSLVEQIGADDPNKRSN
ncbi:MAG: hypothetical protein KF681_12810 [Bdellovibrionaceae bacterium]|nr:hypothetical protein [Pseudobdellovibrionaceae bacterium]